MNYITVLITSRKCSTAQHSTVEQKSPLHLLPRPVPAHPPLVLPQAHHNTHQALGADLRRKQPVRGHACPKRPTHLRLHGSRVQAHGERPGPRDPREVDVERLGHAVDPGLGRAVRVPPAEPVVAGRAHAR